MLLHIPPEILTQVILLLPLKSIIVCKQVNHYIHSLISESVEIRYLVQLLLSEYVDNPHSSLSTNERLALLEKRNRSKGIDARVRKRFKIPFVVSGIYDLTGGIYLLGGPRRKSLHYMYLPDKADFPNYEEIEWRGKEIRMEYTIIDMGLSVYENDLLAVITMCVQMTSFRYLSDIRLHFYQVSTALPHPEAQRPVISVMQVEVDWGRPTVGIEIVGNNLVLILAYSDSHHRPDDRIFIYDWKHGALKMVIQHTYICYNIFLTPHSNGTLEYWRVPKGRSDAPSQPFFKLALPPLCPEDNVGIDTIECRAEPSPTSGFRYSPKPFHPDPYRAIAIFKMRIRSREFHDFLHIIQDTRYFFLFVHRSSLVECLNRPVPYDDWGRDVCRWLPADDYSTEWITTTSGQKCALFPEMGGSDSDFLLESITMLDFNQVEVARVSAIQEHSNSRSGTEIEDGDGDGDGDEDEDEDWVDERDEEILIDEDSRLDDSGRCFLDDVYGRLPFKRSKTTHSFVYSGVLMDEERVIGIQDNGCDIIYHGE
ncbi:hypothetical protein AGABI2DRAFT_186799 [Agaricus bisporus var. bisporus H97]|uniref:hypothetical protein n=1 Tax=Agaricus bisporus var. bisporus (strain H97 / ATCC MYA-4626 / FGSC 10389) TaxID=936046 RepID=UPI00029F5283|nr:hypothetical protein AGABI2DRAFT_186799 [Agaricus bisporus var. bisporus H97]EKV46184.1 hypothetical protein AGABI2DRAFT_186799 [Agaricus bisporus var. bisporus H97]